jgi:hypothetical protein
LNLARLRQQKCGETFESSLRGDIDRARAWIEFRIKTAKRLVWWGFLPAGVAAALWVIVLFRLTAAPAWIDVLTGAFMAAAFGVEFSCLQNAIRNRYEPHQRELESLHRKLTEQ